MQFRQGLPIWGKINISWPNSKNGHRYKILHPKTKKPTKIPNNGWRFKKETFFEMIDYDHAVERIEQQIFSMQRDTVIGVNYYPEDKEIDEFCKIAHRVIGDIGFETKQSIVRKIVDTIVGTQNNIKVYGHLALNSSIIVNVWKGGIQDVKFETSSRDKTDQSTTLDFRFELHLPSPRKVRIITLRDDYGRIMHSTPPPLILGSPSESSYGFLQD